MPLLPETIPFLAELLEDEDEATEKCAQDAVRTLEEIDLGRTLAEVFLIQFCNIHLNKCTKPVHNRT